MTRTEKTLAALNSWEKRPFTYGSADCCQFAAHVARAITGRDYMSAFEYANEQEANALIDDLVDLSRWCARSWARPPRHSRTVIRFSYVFLC